MIEKNQEVKKHKEELTIEKNQEVKSTKKNL